MSGYAFTTIADPLAGPGPYPGGVATLACAINNAGQVVGTYGGNGTYYVFLYSGSAHITLQNTMLANLHASDFHFV